MIDEKKKKEEEEAIKDVLTSLFLAFLVAIFFGGIAAMIAPFFLSFFQSCLIILGVTVVAGVFSFFWISAFCELKC